MCSLQYSCRTDPILKIITFSFLESVLERKNEDLKDVLLLILKNSFHQWIFSSFILEYKLTQ